MTLKNSHNKCGYFSLQIANLCVQINCHHEKLAERLVQRYHDFAPSQEKINFFANINWIGKERQTSLLDTKANFREGILHFSAPGYEGIIDGKSRKGKLTLSSAQPIEDIDYYLRTVYALLAHDAGGVLMHTAGIVRNQKAYLFFGHSGSGKTTVCRVSQDNCTILNDDLILLLPQDQSWLAYGTPFWNPTQVRPSAQKAFVSGMFLLTQAKEVRTHPLSTSRALAALISNVPVIPEDSRRSQKLIEILLDMQQQIPISELLFLPDNSFWNVIAP